MKSSTQKRTRAALQEIEDAMGLGGVVFEPRSRNHARSGDLFVHGPLRWLDLCLIAKRGKAALCLWLLINLRWRMRNGEPWVTLPNQRVRELGVNDRDKRRGLLALRDEGLIRIAPPQRGKPSLVALVREERR